MGRCDGSFAEYACARAERLAPKTGEPRRPEQAAAVPVSGALSGLRDAGKLRPEQTVSIIGAAGGVGSYASSLAKAFGAVVTGVCSTSKAELVREIGADEVIDYTREDFTEGTRQFDLILDTAGRRPWATAPGSPARHPRHRRRRRRRPLVRRLFNARSLPPCARSSRSRRCLASSPRSASRTS